MLLIALGLLLANNTWHHIAMVVTKGSLAVQTQEMSRSILMGLKYQTSRALSPPIKKRLLFRETQLGVLAQPLRTTGAEVRPVFRRLGLGFDAQVAYWCWRPFLLTISERFTTLETVTFDLTDQQLWVKLNSSSNLQYYFRFENDYTDTKGNASDATTEGNPVVYFTSPTPP